MADLLTIACLQTRPMPNMRAALDEALPLAKEAMQSGAQILFLPEYCGGLVSDGARLCPPSAPEGEHEFLAEIREFAAQAGIWMSVGSVAVDAPDGKIINRGFILLRRGGLPASMTRRWRRLGIPSVMICALQVSTAILRRRVLRS